MKYYKGGINLYGGKNTTTDFVASLDSENEPVDRNIKRIIERAQNSNDLLSINPVKCLKPNNAVVDLVTNVLIRLKNKENSNSMKYFYIIEIIIVAKSYSYKNSSVKTILRDSTYSGKYNLNDIIKEINEEIENQLVENKQNNCYQYMEKQIKESAKKIFYEQIDEDIELTTAFDDYYGGYLSLWNDFPIDADWGYPDFQLKCKNFKAVSIAATLEKEAAEAPGSEAPVEAAVEAAAAPS